MSKITIEIDSDDAEMMLNEFRRFVLSVRRLEDNVSDIKNILTEKESLIKKFMEEDYDE
tara:strand:+ start:212 stop:388 length:177 start_codon:yes stop_codon:yes gene_type:complete